MHNRLSRKKRGLVCRKGNMEMDVLEKKLEILNCLNKAFDAFVYANYSVACEKTCAACCTRDVCATTLEAHRMLDALKKTDRKDLVEKMRQTAEGELFRPKVTTNALAFACMNQEEPPMEEPADEPGVCPFLEENLCAVYEDRPFTCRGMFSTVNCVNNDGAELPPELITIVSICWQIIEHLDVGGLYGNIYDLMASLDNPKTAFKYASGEQLISKGKPPTRPVPGFLVPPEQQAAVQRFLDDLYAVDCGGKTFRERMGEVRNNPF